MRYTVSGIAPPLLWRTVRSDPPTEDDFLSMEALGRPRRKNTPPELWSGVSTFADPTIAAAIARRFGHGDFLARLALDAADPIRWEKTPGEGHFTIWGTPAEMLTRVVDVVAIADVLGEEDR